MNLGSFFTVQHAVRAFTSSHPASMCLSLFTLHPFPMFYSSPLHFLPPLASWFPSPSAGPDDEFPLHAAQAALTREEDVLMQAISLFSPGTQRTSAYTWNTHTHSQLFYLVCVCVCVCVFSSTDRPGVTHHSVIDRNPGNSSSHPEDLHRDQAVRAK